MTGTTLEQVLSMPAGYERKTLFKTLSEEDQKQFKISNRIRKQEAKEKKFTTENTKHHDLIEKKIDVTGKVSFAEIAQMAPGSARRALLNTLTKEERQSFWQFFRSNKREAQKKFEDKKVEEKLIVKEDTNNNVLFASIFEIPSTKERKEQLLKLTEDERVAYKAFTREVRQKRRELKANKEKETQQVSELAFSIVDEVTNITSQTEALFTKILETPHGKERRNLVKQLPESLIEAFHTFRKSFKRNQRAQAKLESNTEGIEWDSSYDQTSNTLNCEQDMVKDEEDNVDQVKTFQDNVTTTPTTPTTATEVAEPISWINLLPEDIQIQFENLARSIVTLNNKPN